MKLLAIALKDLLRSSRSTIFYVFAFGVPMLTSLIFFFAFGGIGSDGDSFELNVIVVNLDAPSSQYGGFSAGQLLLQFLQSENVSEWLLLTKETDPASARTAVDQQKAAVAIIIPAGFTSAMLEPEGQAAIELYKDPTLTLDPSIVKGLISQFADGFSGSKIATNVIQEQLGDRGLTMDEGLRYEIAMQYKEWAETLGASQQGGTNLLIDVRSPSSERANTDMRTRILGQVMAGMMVFYVFFTGATSCQSILQEDEAGTLSRIFSTPTPQSTILGGKFLATLATITIQVSLLLLASALFFNINWGAPLPVILVAASLVALATSTGILITSLLKNTRQAGIVYGGVLTMAGMVGMMSTFTVGVPDTSNVMDTVSLFVPQGWAVLAWKRLLEGGGLDDVLLPVIVMLGLALVFFLAGVLKFRKRFA